MLVLSRRPGQRVVFPSLGITVEVLRSRGAVTRLGIEAPEDIPILRDEILANSACLSERCNSSSPEERERLHDWKNKLNQMMLKLEVLQRQLELGQASDPELRLSELFSDLMHLERTTKDVVSAVTYPTVLIVEDQANERELLATCLRLRGINVATAGSGHEAFDYLNENELPDLILLDMRMPDVDGPAFLKSLRDNDRLSSLRVFAVSGLSPQEVAAEQLHLDGWISKPVRIDALLRAVRVDDSPVVITA